MIQIWVQTQQPRRRRGRRPRHLRPVAAARRLRRPRRSSLGRTPERRTRWGEEGRPPRPIPPPGGPGPAAGPTTDPTESPAPPAPPPAPRVWRTRRAHSPIPRQGRRPRRTEGGEWGTVRSEGWGRQLSVASPQQWSTIPSSLPCRIEDSPPLRSRSVWSRPRLRRNPRARRRRGPRGGRSPRAGPRGGRPGGRHQGRRSTGSRCPTRRLRQDESSWPWRRPFRGPDPPLKSAANDQRRRRRSRPAQGAFRRPPERFGSSSKLKAAQYNFARLDIGREGGDTMKNRLRPELTKRRRPQRMRHARAPPSERRQPSRLPDPLVRRKGQGRLRSQA